MVPADQLQIDIFVTKAKPARPPPEKTQGQEDDDLAMPNPSFAKSSMGGHTGSSDSLASMMSQDHLMDNMHGEHENGDTMVDDHLEESYADIIDLTNFEDEEDNDDPNELLLSDRMQKQGKLRRARTRKTIRREARDAARNRHHAHTATPAGPPHITVSHDEEGDEITEAPYDQYDPFSSSRFQAHSPLPSQSHDYEDGEDDNDIKSIYHQGPQPHGHRQGGRSKARPNTMVLLETGNLDPQGDAAIWIDSVDYEAMQELSEMARPGKPKLSQVLEEEIELAQGSIIVGSKS